MLSLSTLPDEMVEEILRHLDAADLCAALAVNHAWHRFASAMDDAWRTQAIALFPALAHGATTPAAGLSWHQIFKDHAKLTREFDCRRPVVGQPPGPATQPRGNSRVDEYTLDVRLLADDKTVVSWVGGLDVAFDLSPVGPGSFCWLRILELCEAEAAPSWLGWGGPPQAVNNRLVVHVTRRHKTFKLYDGRQTPGLEWEEVHTAGRPAVWSVAPCWLAGLNM